MYMDLTPCKKVKPRGFQEVKAPRFQDNRHNEDGKVSRTHRPPLPHRYSFMLEAESNPGPQSMKNSNGTIGNRTRDLPTCSAVPQPTAPPRTQPNSMYVIIIILCASIDKTEMYNRNRLQVPATERQFYYKFYKYP